MIVIIGLVVAIIALVVIVVALFLNVSANEAREAELREEIEITTIDDDPPEPTATPEPDREEADDEVTPETYGDTVTVTVDIHVEESAIQGDGIYLLSTDREELTVTRISTAGGDVETITVPWSGWWPWIEAFSVTDDGTFLFLALEFDIDTDEDIYLLAEYDVTTGTLTYQDVTAALHINPDDPWLASAVFDLVGNLIYSVWDDDMEELFFVLGRDGSSRGEIELGEFATFQSPARMRDGQMVLFGRDQSEERRGDSLMGIDIETASLSDELFLNDRDTRMTIWQTYSAASDSPFDLYVDMMMMGAGNIILYGLDLAAGELTPLFDWEELEIIPDWGDMVFFLADGRLAIVERQSQRDNFWADVTIFMP